MKVTCLVSFSFLQTSYIDKIEFCNVQFSGHVDGIAFLDPKGDGRHLISNSKDQTIKLWDIRSV